MWTRSELKARGRARVKANYWYCVLVILILMIITGTTASRSGSAKMNEDGSEITINAGNQVVTYAMTEEGPEIVDIHQLDPAVARTMSLLTSVVAILNILVFAPLRLGGKAFFLKNTRENARVEEMKKGFIPSWFRNVLSLFLTGLFTALWTMLFIIPGIVKAYAYRMVPYILADDPDIDALDAITKSRQMMKGHKWRAFVLDLSFLGWYILGLLTAGIGLLFWVEPYVEATNAELYRVLKGEPEPEVQYAYFEG